MANTAYYTEEGLKKLLDELNHMKMVERPHISQVGSPGTELEFAL